MGRRSLRGSGFAEDLRRLWMVAVGCSVQGGSPHPIRGLDVGARRDQPFDDRSAAAGRCTQQRRPSGSVFRVDVGARCEQGFHHLRVAVVARMAHAVPPQLCRAFTSAPDLINSETTSGRPA